MIDDGHKLALQLAPELSTAGLKLLRHVDGWPMPLGTKAYAIFGRHIAIRDELRRRGEWQHEWGSFIVFVDDAGSEAEFLGLLLHEMGHQLPAAPPIPDDGAEPTDQERGMQQLQLAAWCTDRRDTEPWRGHDANWIRRVLHLRYRAEREGIDVPLESLNVAGPRYGLSMPQNYLDELGHEPAIMFRRTFAEIEAEPMPPRFARLFVHDALEFYRNLLIERYMPCSEQF